MKKFILPVTLLLAFAFLSCQKEVSTSPEEALTPKTLLIVDSKPQGSKIYINHRNTGQFTPDTLVWLETGNHLVTLKSNVYKDSSIVVKITDDDTNFVFFDYTTNPTMLGSLYIDSKPPGAEIFLNDSNTTLKTPIKISKLQPGDTKITYKLSGHWDMDAIIKVVSERTITVDRKLIDSTVWVNYTPTNVGLPVEYYNDIEIQDGYIKWIASHGEGLIRYDDTEWTIYNTDNSAIPSNVVKSVKVTENGIWIATDYGIAVLNNGSFTVYNSGNSPLPDAIRAVFPLPGGKIWVATESKGVYYFDGSGWTHYHKDNAPLFSNYIASLFYYDGVVWIGTMGEGLILFDGTNWLRIFNSLPSPRIDDILVNGSEVLLGCVSVSRIEEGTPSGGGNTTYNLVNYRGGLSIMTNVWTTYREAGTDIVAVARDNNGDAWFSDYSTGLGKKAAAGGLQKYPLYKKITSIAIDGAGNKWLTTFGQGIVKYKGN